MTVLSVLMLLTLFLTRKDKGPVWALMLAFLACVLPISTGLVRYQYFDGEKWGFAALLGGFLACYCLGALMPWTKRIRQDDWLPPAPAEEALLVRKWALIAWFAAMLGTGLLLLDYAWMGGSGLNDLAALRDLFVAREATWAARISSVLTWGCLYCFGYSISFRSVLSRRDFWFFLMPIGGYFLTALLSAGRQAAFQILLVIVIFLVSERAWAKVKVKWRPGKSAVIYLFLIIVMIAYMGYVAGARNDGAISFDKTITLTRLFDFELAPWAQDLIDKQDEAVQSAEVEGLIYFTSSIALFSKFVVQAFPSHTMGAMTFPFIMRQLEPLTGISVIGSLRDKMDVMRDSGVIAAGWTTAISSYILDAGLVGAAAMLFLQGLYSGRQWYRSCQTSAFNDRLIAVLCILGAAYMPLIPVTSDTNLLLLWAYCIYGRRATAVRAKSRLRSGVIE